MSGEEETVDLSFLTEMEKESILGVLQRDKTLREMEAQRVRRLRRELERLREKGAARGQGRGQQALVAVQSAGEGVPDGSCARCLQPLGWAWLAGGDLCPACLQRVCRACRVPAKGGGGGARAGGGEWQCEACHREAEIRTASGEWFRQARAERFSCAASDGSDIVTASLRRRQKKKREAAGDIFLESHARAPPEQLLAKPNNGLAVGTPTATRSASKKPADNTKSYGLSRKPSKSRNKRGDEATHGVLHHDAHAAKERSDPKADSVGKAAPPFTGSAASRAEHSPSAYPSDAAPGGRGNVIVATAAAGIAAAPPTPGGSVPTAGSLLPPPDGISLGSRGSPPRRRDGTRTDSNGNRVSSSSPSSSGFPSPPASRLATTSTLSPPNKSPGPKMEGPARGKETPTRSPQGSRVGGKSSSESPHPPSASVSSPSTVSWGSSDAPAGASPVPASPARSIPSIGTPEHKASLCSSSSLCSDTDAPPRSSGGAARVSGDINFSVSYDYRVGVLSLTLRQCRNLAYGEERTKRCDPYVKVYLLPDKSRQGKRKTKIKKNTINPVFNETLKYAISHTQLEVRCVHLSVWHHDSFRHNSFLGQASLPLDCCDLERGDDRWCALQPRVENITEASPQYKGELILALKYIAPAEQPEPESPPDGKGKGKRRPLPTGELHINIKGAKNLTAAKAGRTSNPFVKGYLLPDEHKVTKQKTPVVRKTVNPVWNHTFIFEGLPVQELPEVSLELTVWDHESLSSNHFLGGVRLGTGTGFSYERVAPWNDARGDEQAAFLRIAETPGVWVPVALMLRANMEARAF
ncbi:synaptotagmin-like protein 4 isoform X4 [Lethenteron reissneri]|uniref:synaptotagmin-like protein 4 isoform X4 n=1 Tax=Lethenteron reissneri TaxID=7753 RepID=UPI002AB66DE0|nr:synaptotagmin-like protein 4 isoform X4 [Lethenteron reissneri]